MNSIDVARAVELQRDAASAYSQARIANDGADTAADLDLATEKQEAAAVIYKNAVAARGVAIGI